MRGGEGNELEMESLVESGGNESIWNLLRKSNNSEAL